MLSQQPLGTRRPGRVHKTLHKHQIEPAIEFVADLSKMCNTLKPEAFVGQNPTRLTLEDLLSIESGTTSVAPPA